MKKIFSFNKFFIAFWVFFLIVWIALQVISYMRLTSMANTEGVRILSWTWPEKNIQSCIEIYETKVLRKNHNDAIVKVLAKQSIRPIRESQLSLAPLDRNETDSQGKAIAVNSKCAVILTYYRTNNQWFLGRVDCE